MKSKLYPITIFLLGSISGIGTSFCQNIGELYPSSRTLIDLGIAEHDKGEFEKALAHYEQVQQGDSLYDLSLYERAYSCGALEKYEEVIKICDEILENPTDNYTETTFLKAAALEKLGRFEDAELTYDKMIREFPYWSKPHFEKAVYYADIRKDYKSSLDEARASFNLNKKHARTHHLIGTLAAEAGQPAIACMAYFMATVMNPGDSKFVANTLGLIESIGNDNFEVTKEIDPALFEFGASLEGLNQIIQNRVALSKKYKSKVKTTYTYTRVMQIICEKLPEKAENQDPLLTHYIEFYRHIWELGYFSAMVYAPLSSNSEPEIVSLIKKNKKTILAFANEVGSYVDLCHKKTRYWNNDTWVEEEFHPNLTFINSIGKIDEKGQRQGLWRTYYKNGRLETSANYVDGEPEGEGSIYFPNGNLRATKVFKAGRLNGKVNTYNEIGIHLKSEEYINDTLCGVVMEYSELGHPQGSYETKNLMLNGFYKTFDSNGNLEIDVTAVDNVLTGEYIKYYPSRNPAEKGQLVNGKIDGPYVEYYESGELAAEGNFLKGDRDGKWKWYFKNGQLSEEGSYSQGNATGLWKAYHPDGKIETERTLKSNKLDGSFVKYDRYGTKYAETEFRNGKALKYQYFTVAGEKFSESTISTGKIKLVHFNELRRKQSEGLLNKDLKEGEWRFYNLNGTLKSVQQFRDDLAEGPLTTYYSNGLKKGEYFYRNDELDGFYREYAINGVVSEEGYFSNGKLHGPVIQYALDSTIINRSFYWKGLTNGWRVDYNPDGRAGSKNYYVFGVNTKMISFDSNGIAVCTVLTPQGNGEYYTCHEDGSKRFVSSIKNGILQEKTTDFHPDGSVRSVCHWANSRKEGEFKSYHVSGKIEQEGNYVHGTQSGLWKTYNEDGILSREYELEDGDYDGKYISYYDFGAKAHVRNYDHDERDGIQETYAADGTLAIRTNYHHGVLIGYSYLGKNGEMIPEIPVGTEKQEVISYYPNGKIAVQFTWLNNSFDGEYKRWNTDGKLLLYQNYENGMSVGLTQSFYPGGKVLEEEQYQSDELHGLQKYYHDNGKLKREINYHLGDRHGHARFFDHNGKLIMEGDYVFDFFYRKK